jgi:hypothetical protein
MQVSRSACRRGRFACSETRGPGERRDSSRPEQSECLASRQTLSRTGRTILSLLQRRNPVRIRRSAARSMAAFHESTRSAECPLLAGYRLTGVARALVTTAVTTVDSMSSVTSVSSLVSALMVATAVVSV